MIRSQIIIVLRDKFGRILLQLRDEKPKRYPNYWAFFGGGIEKGETPEKAFRRELKEELGRRFKNYKFFRKYKLKDKFGSIEEYVYIISIKSLASKLRLKLGEGRGLAFLSCKEIKKIKTPEYEKSIFDDLCKLNRA